MNNIYSKFLMSSGSSSSNGAANTSSNPMKATATDKKISPCVTPPRSNEDLLGDSWIELGHHSGLASGPRTPERVTPLPFSSGDEYLRLLREAQRESGHSSLVVSLASSRRDTPHDSPKSPPNSPNPEQATGDDLKGIYINYWNKDGEIVNPKDTDWIWEWSSRPDQLPPKGWNFEHPRRQEQGLSLRLARVGKNSLFSREVLYSLLVTNVLSILLGVGLGVWLTKRGGLYVTRLTAA